MKNSKVNVDVILRIFTCIEQMSNEQHGCFQVNQFYLVLKNIKYAKTKFSIIQIIFKKHSF